MATDTQNIIETLDPLQDSISRFRDLVNEPRKHYALFQRPKDFNYVCSAMDIIDDILFALRSYFQSSHSDQGLAYLEIFGVLQSLCVQQDAVRQLSKIITGTSVDLESTYPDIKKIRDVRIRVAGHPVGGNGASHFLVRYTVSKWGFELWKYDQAGGRTTEHITLPALIQKQAVALHAVLNQLIQFIQIEDQKHKEAFMGNSLLDLFKNATYFSSKVFEGVTGRNPMGTVGLECIREIIQKFKSSLKERSAHFEESGFFSHNIPMIEYAVNKFQKYMEGDETQNEDDAYIVARFIQVELKNLAEIAKEIDDEYNAASNA